MVCDDVGKTCLHVLSQIKLCSRVEVEKSEAYDP